MKYNPEKHRRRSIRLRGYDYSQPGAYFITICTQNRLCLFGGVVNKHMTLNESGEMAMQRWLEIPTHYPNVSLDEFVIMPNHVHGIIIINDVIDGTAGAISVVGAIHESPLRPVSPPPRIPSPQPLPPFPKNDTNGIVNGSIISLVPSGRFMNRPTKNQRRKMTLPKIIGRFKMNSAKQINQLRQTPGTPVWQRNYYEHIIRDEHELNRIRRYIAQNPAKWRNDNNYF